MIFDRKQHWEKIYSEKDEQKTSWFQPRPETSLALIEATGEPPSAPIIDVWLEADLLEDGLPGPWRIWHDRAVFHFLVEQAERQRYLEQLHANLAPGGHCIIATFGPEGPEACSGLPVQRYSPQALAQTLGRAFELQETREEQHRTPAGKVQSFVYCRFRYRS